MAEAQAPIILKVLGGTQFGVEVRLDDGEYSFGSGADADIQLTDVAMADLHGVLRVRKGKIELKTEKGRVTTASGLTIEPGEAEWREIAQLDLVTAGTTSFALGDSTANWNQFAGTAGQVSAPSTSGQPRNPIASTSRGHLGKTIAAVALLIVIGLGAAFVTSGEKQLPLITPRGEAARLSAVNEALRALPFPHVLEAEQDVAGQITVSGYVGNSTERRAAEDALIETQVNLHRRIWALDAIQADIEGLINSQNLEVSYSLNDRGVLTLKGVILDPARSQELETLVRSQVFGLADVRNDIHTTDYFISEVEGLINQLGLNGLILARLDGFLIEMTGIIPNEKLDAWSGLVQAYSSRYADFLPMRSFVTLEGRDANNAVPLILGESVDGSVLQGRRLPADAFSEGAAISPEAVLALPEDFDTNSAAANNAPQPDYLAQLPPGIAQLVADFTRSNPDIVDAIVASSTNGRFQTLAQLQNASTGSPGLFGQNGTIGASGATAANGLSSSLEARELLSPPGVISGEVGADDSFQWFPTEYRVDSRQDKLNSALSELLNGVESPTWEQTVQAALKHGVSPYMLSLALKQNEALKQGKTLLKAFRPLAALAQEPDSSENICWSGSQIEIEKLPAILLWLDMMSVDSSTDLSDVDPELRPLLLEAALSPLRITRCLLDSDTQYADMLVLNSNFLAESRRNTRFSEYMFRNEPRFELPITGVNLAGNRYIHMADGTKLTEGSAPTIDSRLSTIGDLGVIIRLAEGQAVSLYPENIGWTVMPDVQ